MKTVAVFLSDEMTTRRLVLAFRNRAIIRSFSHVEEIRDMAATGQIIACIVDMRRKNDALEAYAIDMIARLHASYPAVPVAAYVDFTPQRARDILSAAHAGASDIILGEVDDLTVVAERVVDMSTSIDVAARLKVAITGVVPAHLHDFFLLCVRHAGSGITVEGITARLRRNRKTLANWLVAAHLPPPYRIIGWVRVLVAARLLEDQSRSLEKVARELRFVSGTALRNMIRRYLGISPDILRQNGGFAYALEKFLVAMQGTPQAEKENT